MNICIFGGLGFIGLKLSNTLYRKGNNVTVFTQKKIKENKNLFHLKL